MTNSVARLKENLLKMVGVKAFSPIAQFINPCLTFVLPDVICTFCNQCRDLDLCRDPELTQHNWTCVVTLYCHFCCLDICHSVLCALLTPV